RTAGRRRRARRAIVRRESFELTLERLERGDVLVVRSQQLGEHALDELASELALACGLLEIGPGELEQTAFPLELRGELLDSFARRLLEAAVPDIGQHEFAPFVDRPPRLALERCNSER